MRGIIWALGVSFILNPLDAAALPPSIVEFVKADLLSPTLITLASELRDGDSGELETFWATVRARGTPLIEPVEGSPSERYVTFLYRSTPGTRNVVVRFNGTSMLADPAYFARARMDRLGNSDIWFRTYRMRSDARFPYQLSPNDSLTLLSSVPLDQRSKRTATFIPDPLNPRHYADRDGDSSVVELPDAPSQYWNKRRNSVPTGRIERLPFTSNVLNNSRTIYVYVPAGYDQRNAPLPLLVTTDGEDYAEPEGLPVTLDNLVHSKLIPPVVAVMIGNSENSRGAELLYSRHFNRFLETELLPWVRSRYRVTTSPRQTVMIGSSLGGNAAVFAAIEHPELFGNVIAQSAGYMYRESQKELAPDTSPGAFFETEFPESEWLTRQFAIRPKLPLRFYVETGLMEDMDYPTTTPRFAYPSLPLAARHFRDVLNAKGYELCYHEFNGAHEPLNWRGTMADALVTLLSDRPRDRPGSLCASAPAAGES